MNRPGIWQEAISLVSKVLFLYGMVIRFPYFSVGNPRRPAGLHDDFRRMA